MIKEAIQKVVDGKDLGKEEAKSVFDEIMSGTATESQIASLITALRMKGETADEIQGATESMRKVAADVRFKGKGDILDVVGTGGDKKNSFNISTASAIVAAGAGCIVAKHGNRGVSSGSGAADVLEALGVKIDITPEKNSEILSKIGLAFLFAPSYHPAMKYAGKTRKEIGIRTIFNIVGPLTNPANASTYLVGAYSEGLAEKLAHALAGLGTKKAIVVFGSGYDEITLTDKTSIFEVEGRRVVKKIIKPEDFGFKRCSEAELSVSNAQQSAKIIKDIFEGKERGAKLDVLLLNSGAAIYANMKADTIKEGMEKARKSIASGKALDKLKALIKETNA